MNSIVILCGGNSSGKTTTLKGFFRVNSAKSPTSFIERELHARNICAVSFNSPQEQEPFCEVDSVQNNINKRILKCNEAFKGESYVLIIPFTMSASNADRKKLNEDCILKPIEGLKKRFNVFVIYLRKTNARNLSQKDALMKDIAFAEIETTKYDYDKSAELEKYLKEG